MDSWKKIPVKEEMRKKLNSDVTISNEYLDDMNVINQYINLTQGLNRIYQWYHIFNYNYNKIMDLYPDGNIYAVNSHVIALVSAGRNLADSINNCANNTFGLNKTNEFKKVIFLRNLILIFIIVLWKILEISLNIVKCQLAIAIKIFVLM